MSSSLSKLGKPLFRTDSLVDRWILRLRVSEEEEKHTTANIKKMNPGKNGTTRPTRPRTTQTQPARVQMRC